MYGIQDIDSVGIDNARRVHVGCGRSVEVPGVGYRESIDDYMNSVDIDKIQIAADRGIVAVNTATVSGFEPVVVLG